MGWLDKYTDSSNQQNTEPSMEDGGVIFNTSKKAIKQWSGSPLFPDGGIVRDNTSRKPYIEPRLIDFKRKQEFISNNNIPNNTRNSINNQIETNQTIDKTLDYTSKGLDALMLLEALPGNILKGTTKKLLKKVTKQKPIEYIESNVAPPVESSVGLPIKKDYNLKASRFPMDVIKSTKRTLPKEMEPFLTEVPELTKEQEILRSFGLKYQMGGTLASRTNNWLDNY